MAKHLKYNQIKGIEVNLGGLLWAASQVIGNQSGKFVYMNNGALTLCVDAVAQIFGWANERAKTTASGDVCPGVNVALDAIYRIPVNSGTFVVGMIGDLCDISVSGGVQGAQLDASVENLLIICGGNATDATVDVKINPAVQGAALGADA